MGQPDGWKYRQRTSPAIVREEDRTAPDHLGVQQPAVRLQRLPDRGRRRGLQLQAGRVRHSFMQRIRRFRVLGSETASCVSSRGEYFFPVSDNKADGRADFQVSSYDLYAPRWALPPDVEFKGLDEAPFAAGEFVWTGFDYLGEPTPLFDPVVHLDACPDCSVCCVR